ncbi:MAG: hypothetical protein AAF922_18520 [Pseudomonadota bacterium]
MTRWLQTGSLWWQVCGAVIWCWRSRAGGFRPPRDAVAALALVPQQADDFSVLIEREDQTQILNVVVRNEPLADKPSANAGRPTAPIGDCPHPEPVCLIRQAVFPVSSFDPVGSATRIGSDLLVTNRHVVGGRRDAVVHTPNGPRGACVIPSA